ncbi:hypothetical protein KKG22_00840 [Patescibacteria group bacterium]|nr:hypothetical protein [Patescibacteria group bacterium]MBU1721981.1 hypothetical protein [Patescibacteria group bacterium]MBU1901270.1 hypothetical protein [Patescibacteria group bacterium]
MNLDLSNLPKINGKGLALDIDETLSRTGRAWASEFYRTFTNPEGVTEEEYYNKYYANSILPEWFTQEMHAWVEERRCSSEYQKTLPLIEGAIETVKKIQDIVPITAYITARPTSTEQGTKAWLDIHGFPKASLITKPETIHWQDGPKWKAQVLEHLYPSVVGIVDDNPSMLQYLSHEYQGQVFVFDHEEADLHPQAQTCAHWDMVYMQIQRHFGGLA